MKIDPSLANYRSARHRIKSALTENFNLIGLGGFLAASAALLNPVPLLVGLVLEAAYLLFVPDSKWYEKRLKSAFDGEVQKRLEDLKDQVFPQIHFGIREHFARLKSAREQIGQQSRSEEQWFREALRKLDYLMEKYLQFALKEAQFIRYLSGLIDEIYDSLSKQEKSKLDELVRLSKAEHRTENSKEIYIPAPSEQWNEVVVSVLRSHYQSEIEEIREKSEAETVFATKSILEKRIEVLTRRQDFVNRILQILNNLRHQMQLMSDTFGLINDEIRARSPEQVLADIDEVVLQTNSLTEAIEEVTPLESLVSQSSL